ncbi:high frequency lysogenization protein HflD [Kitasatospora sp. YST-16]|uniref:high frequency lysogenization protein HflD n=1 Tax=unclassified Kitasatospora TaxID=2633591 RepID=UPI000B0B8AB1|nr:MULTISPECIES: high frequency lysogenization protein HflD [unclassified Kitasatospora]WAL70221.1 high frequency lysogenization protein HflD [Kitasatospora sp. YST-16]WNW36262.1 high frequency lysogenization protein HflD [Streptomyces sp. Li-HN-5-13]
MAVHRTLTRTGAALAAALALTALAAPAARAHPLGNFSVNHYLGLTVRADGVDALAVTDLAEIPTLQEQDAADTDHDGTVDAAERTAWATGRCDAAAHRTRLTADGTVLPWTVASAGFAYQDGAAGLRTSRLECHLHADRQLAPDGTDFRVETGADPTRVGWNEITARGDGAVLDRSDVPAASVSRELRDYPRDLLDTPEGVTTAAFRARPGTGTGPAARAGTVTTAAANTWLAALDARLASLGTARHLTLPLGLLAVLLSTVLGAGHALLPGHGKTVMAAYLAGKRGRPRDALTVGATVTLTHTAGVLATGLLLTAFSTLAGDRLLARLGTVSGALVLLVGALLLRDALRSRRDRAGNAPTAETADRRRPEAQPVPVGTAVHALGRPAPPNTGHQHQHHQHHDHGDEPHDHGHEHHDHGHEHHGHGHEHHHHHHGPLGHRHGHGHGHGHHHGHGHGPAARADRRRLIGLGVAGGLVPSPSALLVLLGAVALGRTVFGVALVIAYGVGMAATLTGAGLLLVGLGHRLGPAATHPALARLRGLAPYSALLTALLVLAVGAGMVLRSLPSAL